jgi:hypothetical protein
MEIEIETEIEIDDAIGRRFNGRETRRKSCPHYWCWRWSGER